MSSRLSPFPTTLGPTHNPTLKAQFLICCGLSPSPNSPSRGDSGSSSHINPAYVCIACGICLGAYLVVPGKFKTPYNLLPLHYPVTASRALWLRANEIHPQKEALLVAVSHIVFTPRFAPYQMFVACNVISEASGGTGPMLRRNGDDDVVLSLASLLCRSGDNRILYFLCVLCPLLTLSFRQAHRTG